MKVDALKLEQAQSPGRLGRWAPLGLALIGGLVYLNTLGNPFVFDSVPWILHNQRIHSFANIGQLLTTTNRPVLELTLALNYALGGVDPAGYHALNILIHVLAGLVLYGLVRRTLLLIGGKHWDVRSAVGVGGAVALLWLVHPLNTQAVTYTIQRGESLAGLFFLLTLYGFMRYAAGGARLWAVVAVASCWMGAGTKEVIATAPLVVLVYDRVFLSQSWREPLAKRWPVYLGLFLMWVPLAVQVTRGIGGEDASAGFGLEAKMLSRWTYLLTQAQVIVEVYLRKALVPSPLVLDYAWVPAIPEDTPGGEVSRLFMRNVLFQGLIVVSLLGVSVWGVVKARWWGFVGAAFFLILAPTSSFVPIADLAVEHRMYLPLICVVLPAVLGCRALLRKAMPEKAGLYGVALLTIAAVAFSVQTLVRNQDYRSRVAIWDTVVQARPNNARGWHNLGKALEDEQRLDEAAQSYRNVLRIMPNYMPSNYNLGVLMLRAGRADEAMKLFERVVELDPREARAHEYLGLLWIARGDAERAVIAFRAAVEADPGLASARQNLAEALNDAGRPGEAVAVLEEAIAQASVLGFPDEVVRRFKARLSELRAQADPAPASP